MMARLCFSLYLALSVSAAVVSAALVPTVLVLALGFPGLAWASASAAHHCTDAGRSGWMSWLEVGQMLEKRNMRIVRLRVSDYRCFLVTTQNEHGAMRDLVIHPVSGRIFEESEHPPELPKVPWRWTVTR